MSIASVGPYHLGARLGAGGMGEVFAATHTRYRHPAAVKLLRREAATEAGRAAFEREIRAIAALDHPSIVRIHDRGLTDTGQPWLAMEQAAGHVGFPTDWDALLRVLRDVLDALGTAHAAGLLHLDVKPSNVLVRADGSHALADFGIVVLRGAVGEAVDGARWGTPAYMAPERFDRRPERLVEATDLYAVGVLAHHLCTGAPPFGDTSWTEAALAHRSEPVPELRPRFPVPSGLAEWVQTALTKPPAERFRTAAEARSALEALGSHTVVAVGSGADLPVGATLATVADDQVVPLGELVGTPRARRMPVPSAWPPERRERRLEGTGIGLLGLLGVPFVGRDDARQALWDALVRVSEGGGARTVGVHGPRGVGRTRLGEHFTRCAAASAGVRTVRIPGDAVDPAAAALEGVFGAAGLAPERKADAVALRLGTVDPAVLGSVCSAPPEEALLAALRALAADQTVLVWLDDALSSEQSARLARTVADARIPGVLTVIAMSDQRRTANPERAAGLSADTTLALAPLDPAAVRTLLADWVGLQPDLVAEVAALSEGDVGLALRVVHEGVDRGTLEPGPKGLRGTGAPLSLPADALHAWEGCLPALPGLEHALEVAAVLGPEVDRARLHRALSSPALAERLEHALLGAGLAVPTPDGWRWAGAGLRALVLRDARDLPSAHRAAAAAYADTDDAAPATREARWQRGVHHLEAGDLTRALPDLFRAASEFVATGQMVTAERRLSQVRHAMEAHGLPESDPAWGDLWRAYGILGPTHQGNAKTWEYNRRALDLARQYPDDPEWQRIRRSCLGGMIWHANIELRPRVAARYVEEFQSTFADWLERSPQFWENLAWHRLTLGDPEGAVASFTHAVGIARRMENRHMSFVSDAGLGVAMCHAGRPEARAHLHRAGDALLEAGYHSARGDVACVRGDHYRFAGELDTARHWYQEALRASQEGQARADIGFQANWALFLRDSGELDAAERELAACVARLDVENATWSALLPLFTESVHALRGRADGAVVRASLATLEETGFYDRDVARALELLVDRVEPADATAIRTWLRRRNATTASAQNTADS